jgi:radical SAM protein with 4Fe4S-binding SPASM domain
MSFLTRIRAGLTRISRTGGQDGNHPPAPGLYHFRREEDGGKARLHLRIDPDGQGLLVVNASRVFHLNPTAAAMAFLELNKMPQEQAVAALTRWYRVTKTQACQDYAHISGLVAELARPDGACPVCELDLETTAPFSARPTAPYRMDLAVTYRCNNDCAHCYNIEGRDLGELPSDDWKRILGKAWELGIPHIIFTGGEPTLRDDLPEMIAHAEKLGQITGLNTNARRLSDPRYLDKLIAAGLDHVQVTLESCESEVHDQMVGAKGAFSQTVRGLKNALATPLYVMTNTTMLHTNLTTIPATLDFLAEIGVRTVGLNALIHSGRGATVGTGLQESELTPLLALARQKTDAAGQRLIWYTPTQYCSFDPMELDLGVKGCTAALYNMCVEPDGSVLPCQSYYQPLGKILEADWETIWNHDLSVRLRERKGLPEKCSGCALLAECGGGCPLQFEFDRLESSPA